MKNQAYFRNYYQKNWGIILKGLVVRKLIISKIILLQMSLKEKLINEIENNKIRQGILLKQSKYLKEWRERWMILTFNFLISFKDKNSSEVTQIIELSSIEYLKSYMYFKEQPVQAVFKIKSEKSILYLSAKDSDQKWSWIVSLERLLDYRLKGATKYNNLTYIKTMGFKSYAQYQQSNDNKSVPQISDQLKLNTSPTKDQQALIMMKELFKKQHEINLERDLLRKEKKILIKQIEQFEAMRAKNPQTINLITKVQKQYNNQIKTSFVEQSFIQIKQIIQEQEKKTIEKQKLKLASQNNTNLHQESANKSSRELIIKGVFNQFATDSKIYFGLKYFIDFIAQISGDQSLGFCDIISDCISNHKNRQHFVHILIEILNQYSEYRQFDHIARFLCRLLQEEDCKVIEIISQQQKRSINKKVVDIFIRIQSEDKEQLINLLKLVQLLVRKLDLNKNQQLLDRVNKMKRLSKREEIRLLANQILVS